MIVDYHRSSHEERDLAIRRALKGDRAGTSLLSRLAGRLRPVGSPAPAIIHEMHVLTDKVCHLADGSAGRIVVREADGELIEVCVAT